MEVRKGDIVYYETMAAAQIVYEGAKVDLIDSVNCLYIEE